MATCRAQPLNRTHCLTHKRDMETCNVAARREGVGIAEKCVPTNWLDPLLTGPDAVLGKGHDNREIEALLRGVQDRIRAKIKRLRRG